MNILIFILKLSFIISILSLETLTIANASELSEEEFWSSVEEKDKKEYYLKYLKRYPAGKFIKIAIEKINAKNALEIDEKTKNIKSLSETKDKHFSKISGNYNAKFIWTKSIHNFIWGKSPVYSCDVALKIQKDFSVPETKIVCPGWQGYTEWYYRGLFNSDGTASSFLVNHAYGTGE